MADSETRCVSIGPALLDEPPLWSAGPFYSGLEREHVLALQMVLMNPEVEAAGLKFAELFNEQAIQLGFISAEQHGASPEALADIRGRGKPKK